MVCVVCWTLKQKYLDAISCRKTVVIWMLHIKYKICEKKFLGNRRLRRCTCIWWSTGAAAPPLPPPCPNCCGAGSSSCPNTCCLRGWGQDVKRWVTFYVCFFCIHVFFFFYFFFYICFSRGCGRGVKKWVQFLLVLFLLWLAIFFFC